VTVPTSLGTPSTALPREVLLYLIVIRTILTLKVPAWGCFWGKIYHTLIRTLSVAGMELVKAYPCLCQHTDPKLIYAVCTLTPHGSVKNFAVKALFPAFRRRICRNCSFYRSRQHPSRIIISKVLRCAVLIALCRPLDTLSVGKLIAFSARDEGIHLFSPRMGTFPCFWACAIRLRDIFIFIFLSLYSKRLRDVSARGLN